MYIRCRESWDEFMEPHIIKTRIYCYKWTSCRCHVSGTAMKLLILLTFCLGFVVCRDRLTINYPPTARLKSGIAPIKPRTTFQRSTFIDWDCKHSAATHSQPNWCPGNHNCVTDPNTGVCPPRKPKGKRPRKKSRKRAGSIYHRVVNSSTSWLVASLN